MLRCYEAQIALKKGLQLFCSVGSGVSYLPLHKFRLGKFAGQLSSDTMVLKPGIHTFDSVCRCEVQVLSAVHGDTVH